MEGAAALLPFAAVWIVSAGAFVDGVSLVGGLVALILGLAGLAALVVAGTRIKTRDDTIATQKGYIEALVQDRNDLSTRVAVLEGRDEVRTTEFAREIAGAINRVMLEAFDGVFQRLEDLERRRG